jgi:hypothetical protein
VIPIVAVLYWYRIAAVRLPQSFRALDRTWNERAVPILSRWLGWISRTLENDMGAGLMLVLLVVAMLLSSFGTPLIWRV